MTDKQTRRGLGRGLSALMSDSGGADIDRPDGRNRSMTLQISIDLIDANPEQPRRQFEPGPLEDLADSIREKGIIQPLILRIHPQNDKRYQIVAGERRWRAAQIAQLHQIPAIVRDLDDTEVLELAIIENIQRADLNPVDEAAGYQQLMQRFGHTQEQVSKALGKSRPHIANLMRLLNLPIAVQAMVADGRLSAGHARALVVVDDPLGLAEQVIARNLSVRETERLAKGPQGLAKGDPRKRQMRPKDADTLALEEDLASRIGMLVKIDHVEGAASGYLTVHYASLDQLDELIGILGRMPLAADRNEEPGEHGVQEGASGGRQA